MATEPEELDVHTPLEELRDQAMRRAREAVQDPGIETAEDAITHIAQDAVLILRRELAYRAELSRIMPGLMSMTDTVALLRLTTELGEAVKRGSDETEQQVDYSPLSPQERVQLAALLLKVNYA